MPTKNKKPILMMFSGQGSQYYNMGSSLYQSHSTFHSQLNDMDTLISSQLGWSLISVLFNENKTLQQPLDDLSTSHIAIFAIEVALAKTLMAHGLQPIAALGVSIGEVAAMVIAGMLSVEAGVEVVWAQSQQVTRYCSEAAMLAILAPLSNYKIIPQFTSTHLAAVNFNNHFIVSADLDRAATLEQTLKAKGITYQRLPVRYGFHSSLIAPAAEAYLEQLQSFPIQPLLMTYYSCAYGGSQNQLPYSHPWDAVLQPIALQQTLQKLTQLPPHLLIDVGPGSTLATMAKYALPSDTPHQISGVLSPMGHELNKLEQLLAC